MCLKTKLVPSVTDQIFHDAKKKMSREDTVQVELFVMYTQYWIGLPLFQEKSAEDYLSFKQSL